MQSNPERRSNEDRTRATRAALTKAARRLFVEKGYAETGTPEIVKAANVTRGALYHHFADKADLFRAVVRQEYAAVAAEIDAAAKTTTSTIDALTTGGDAFLRAMQQPGRVRLMLLDGPAILGRLELDAIDRETSADTLRLGLKSAMDAGEIRPLPLDALAAQLSAMFDRAALGVAKGDAAEDHLSVLNTILRGLVRH
ncbi:TetR/AcrR family transcriptional regulator [Aestuariibius sp. 2305UL40-4]|uniref:TetR/AcrR family transcriptional regulator n=1 Tax=Aestuariibius violaceus TaxID=3234132 RepID=UPI00345EF4B2